MRGAAILLVLLASALPRPALADTRFEPVVRAIEALIESEQLPSVAVAVVRNGEIVWDGAWGWADRERRVRATPDTPYSLASISKPVTATAVMQLVEAGHVALNREANAYLGPVPIRGPHASRATVRRILSHTAGLPMYFRPFFPGPSPPMEELIARDAVLIRRPGRYIYSNLGYGILEHIIARVSGMSYDEYLRRRIFEPLRLESASVPLSTPDGAAVRYDNRNRPLPFYDLGHRGASSVFASARDLARFGTVHLKERLQEEPEILTRRSIDEMQRVQTGSSTDRYGLGWRIIDEQTHYRRIEHTGGMPGVTTVLSLFPAQRVVIVVLANRRSETVIQLADRVAAAAMPQYGWELRRAGRLVGTE
jgi:CubicO group peptidase (beta-lactamase class C family)